MDPSARADRRRFLQGLALTAALGSQGFHAGAAHGADRTSQPDARPARVLGQGTPLTPDQALQDLLEGNQRFTAAYARDRDTITRRIDLVGGQSPHATILGCADSRVVPELVFDADLGELFVCRVAGNVVTSDVLGSIEYAVKVLGTPLIVVLGHEGCGAIDAALSVVTRGAEFEGYLAGLIDQLVPAATRIVGQPGVPLDNAIRANVQMQVTRLHQRDPDFTARVADGRLRIVGAVYQLESGLISLVP
jgi:carbonic anhydrase